MHDVGLDLINEDKRPDFINEGLQNATNKGNEMKMKFEADKRMFLTR